MCRKKIRILAGILAGILLAAAAVCLIRLGGQQEKMEGTFVQAFSPSWNRWKV
ncbi:MAG: hypothetical protein SOZ59_11215 [Candidatus Limivivens sp.]|nr:hypothetical protein [Candidatus Limivivens sp.]